MPGAFVWSLIGAIIAVGRFATILVITAIVAAPRVAYAILIPGLAVHLTFGAASGYVSYHLAKAVARLREEYELPTRSSHEQFRSNDSASTMALALRAPEATDE